MTKADVVRALLRENPDGKPKALAKIASKTFGSPVKPGDVSNYKSAMKRNGELNGKPEVAPEAAPVAAPAPVPKPVAVGHQVMTVTETVEVVRDLVAQLGKAELHKLVDVL